MVDEVSSTCSEFRISFQSDNQFAQETFSL